MVNMRKWNEEQTKKQLKRRKPSSRVFSWAVNHVAFIHKIVLSVDGQLKSDFENELHHFESRGILAPETHSTAVPFQEAFGSAEIRSMLYMAEERISRTFRLFESRCTPSESPSRERK